MTGQIISIGVAAGVLTALLGWRIWRLFKPGDSWLDHPAVFFLLVFFALLTLRLPQITALHEFSVDESQLLAQAMRYLAHPIPWRDVDGTTSGPLDSWLLSLPLLFGAPASWATARTVLWAVQCATLVFIYLALRCFGTRAKAQLSLMPTIWFYALALDFDFTHYSSETLPVLLLCIVIWLLCRVWFAEKFSSASVFLTGLLCGCVPFAKLQASPLAVFLLAIALAMIVFKEQENRGRKIGLLSFGLVIVPAVLMGIVLACGAGNDFWRSYILASSSYAPEDFSTKMEALWILFTKKTDFRGYFSSALAAGLALAAAWAYVREPKPGKKLLALLAAVIGLGMVAVFCIFVAGKGWGHYLLLLIPAQALFFGLALSIGQTVISSEKSDPGQFPKPVHLFMAGFAVVMCFQLGKASNFFNVTRVSLMRRTAAKKTFVGQRILEASRPGDTLSVWGWMPSYYVETGLMPATRDAIGHFMIQEGPYQAYFRQRYLNDLERARPAIFIDAMADGVFTWYWTRIGFRRHESFPELAKFIDDNYSVWMTIHIGTLDPPARPIRIYLLKERMADLKLTAEEITVAPGKSPDP